MSESVLNLELGIVQFHFHLKSPADWIHFYYILENVIENVFII